MKSLISQGATGLLQVLAEDYLSTLPEEASIHWVCNHSRNTQLALLNGYIDVALTYERDQEELAAAEGWSATVGCVFHDHFCLAGPASDPANLGSSTSVREALLRIAKTQTEYHSRADASATMSKERKLWGNCGLAPWDDLKAATWYKQSLRNPAEALIAADKAGAYLLTDRSTLLYQTRLKNITNTTVFCEPTHPTDILMNSCYALRATVTSDERRDGVLHFLQYLLSERGQDVIANFHSKELGGYPLFAAVKEHFAKSYLRGGLPRNGVWYGTKPRARL